MLKITQEKFIITFQRSISFIHLRSSNIRILFNAAIPQFLHIHTNKIVFFNGILSTKRHKSHVEGLLRFIKVHWAYIHKQHVICELTTKWKFIRGSCPMCDSIWLHVLLNKMKNCSTFFFHFFHKLLIGLGFHTVEHRWFYTTTHNIPIIWVVIKDETALMLFSGESFVTETCDLRTKVKDSVFFYIWALQSWAILFFYTDNLRKILLQLIMNCHYFIRFSVATYN